MTITFKCPGCKSICAFRDKYANRRARCTCCNQIFIIPSEQGQQAKKVILKSVDSDPLPGFYEALFKKSGHLFRLSDINNITGWVFIVFIVCVRFFVSEFNFVYSFYSQAISGYVHVYLPIGTICVVILWGVLFWYYIQIIYFTAYDVETLPEIHISEDAAFMSSLRTVFSALYSFGAAFFVSFLPYIVLVIVMDHVDDAGGWLWGFRIFFLLLGSFVMPSAVMNLAVINDCWSILRIDYLIKPIVKAPRPYVTTVLLFVFTVFLQVHLKDYDQLAGESPLLLVFWLIGNIGIQVFAVTAMRSAGLFCRHYNCYFP